MSRIALWILIGVVVFAALILLGLRGSLRADPFGNSPEEILKRRYTRGEIDREGFRRRIDELRK
jgi:uncharacterized membrane protein